MKFRNSSLRKFTPKILISIIILTFMFTLSNAIDPLQNPTFSIQNTNLSDHSNPVLIENNAKPIASYVPNHSNITLTSNTALINFCNGNGTLGTKESPHIIKNYIIDSNLLGSPISLLNINLYLIIRNCTLFNSGTSVITKDAGIRLYNCQNIIIENCTVYNNNNGIYAENSPNNEIKNNSIIDNKYGIYLLSFSDYVNITTNLITKNTNYGINIVMCTNSSIVSNSICKQDTFGTGISISGNSDGTDVHNNNITNNYDGYVINHSKFTNTSMNQIVNNLRYGLYLYYSQSNYVFNNNYTSINPEAGIFLDNSNNNDFKYNYMNGTGYAISTSYDNLIDTTNLINNKPVCYNQSINNLVFDNTDFYGQIILIRCNNSIIKNTNIKNTAAAFLLIECQNTTLLDNNATYNRYGCYLVDAFNSYIDNNNFSASMQAGIYLHDFDNSSIDNSIVDNSYFGIYLDDSDNVTIDFCNATNTNTGIKASFSPSLDINELKAFNVYTGVYLGLCPNSNITNSSFTGRVDVYSDDYGIQLWDSDNSSIENNSIIGLGYGIYNQGSSNMHMKWNNISKSFASNVYLYQADFATIFLNNISQSRLLHGIEIRNTKSSTIKNSSLIGNDDYGIYVYNSENLSIQDNTIESNEINGITIYNAINNTIYHNDLRFNRNNGLYVFNSSDQIISNNIITYNNYTYSSTGFGLFLEKASFIDTFENIIGYNKIDAMKIEDSFNCSFFDNLIYKNELQISTSRNLTITRTNLIDGRPVIFFADLHNIVIDGSEDTEIKNAGQFIILNCNNTVICNISIQGIRTGLNIIESYYNTIFNITAKQNTVGMNLSNCHNCVVKKCDLEINQFGLSVSNSCNNTILFNIIKSNTQNGIDVNGKSSNNTLFCNRIESNDYGIFCHYSTNNTVSSNILILNNLEGIDLDHCTNFTVYNNSISQSTQGIWVYGSEECIFDANKITGSSNCGFNLLYSNYLTIQHNIITYSNQYGLYILGDQRCSFQSNLLEFNIQAGIYIYNSEYNYLDNNTVTQNGEGVFFNDANHNLFSNSTVSHNQQSGFILYNSDYNNFTHNNCSFNSLVGFNFQDASYCILSFNNASYNEMQGVYLPSLSNYNHVFNNILHYNGDLAIVNQGTGNQIYNNDIINTNGGIDAPLPPWLSYLIFGGIAVIVILGMNSIRRGRSSSRLQLIKRVFNLIEKRVLNSTIGDLAQQENLLTDKELKNVIDFTEDMLSASSLKINDIGDGELFQK